MPSNFIAKVSLEISIQHPVGFKTSKTRMAIERISGAPELI
jgi:hypothetical protein